MLFSSELLVTRDQPVNVYVFGSQGADLRALSLHCRGDNLPRHDSPTWMLIAIVPLTLESLSPHSANPALAFLNLKARGFYVGLARPDEITLPQPHRHSA